MANVAPSVMMDRNALTTCVSGKRAAAFCRRGFVPSSENQTPEKNIMGHESRLSRPPANSSLLSRDASMNPREMRHRHPKVRTIKKSR